jgi:hypothetical protein
MAEGIVLLALDLTQNLGSSQPGEANFPRERALQSMAESFSLIKKLPRPFRLVAKKITKIRGDFSCKKILFGHAESGEIILGKVNTILAEIDGDILPKIGQLEGGANMVGELGEFTTSLSVNQKHKSSDGIGTTTAVVEHVGEALITPLDDVLFKGAEEIEKEGVGKVEFSLSFLERFKYPSVGAVVGKALLSVLPGLAVVTENGEALALRRGLSFGVGSGIGISLVG